MSTAVVPFLDIATGVKPKAVDALDPRATRFAFIPVFGITGLPTTAFKREELPANTFIPLRPFDYSLTSDTGAQGVKERLPYEQIIDLQTLRPHIGEFPELAALENEGKAREVFAVLTNPNDCTKYKYELRNSCATCWIDYLRADAPARIVEAFAEDPVLLEAASLSLPRLLQVLEAGVEAARASIEEALDQMERKQKSQFYDVDYANVYHTHQDRPERKTSVNSNNELMKALSQTLGTRPNQLTLEDVKAIVAAEVGQKDDALAKAAARIAELEKKLEAKKETPNEKGK